MGGNDNLLGRRLSERSPDRRRDDMMDKGVTFDLGKQDVTADRSELPLGSQPSRGQRGKQVPMFDSLCSCLAKGLP
jgi:hypothetical protein